MKEVLIKEYNNIIQLNLPYKKDTNKFIFHFLKGAYLEVSGSDPKKYIVKFIKKRKEWREKSD